MFFDNVVLSGNVVALAVFMVEENSLFNGYE